MGMGTLCTAKKAPVYWHGDTLHCQKVPYIWAWGHFALPKRRLYIGMGTLCSSKKAPIYGHGDTLHCQKGPIYGHGVTLNCQKGPHIRAWGHFALPKRPPYMGMGSL